MTVKSCLKGKSWGKEKGRESWFSVACVVDGFVFFCCFVFFSFVCSSLSVLVLVTQFLCALSVHRSAGCGDDRRESGGEKERESSRSRRLGRGGGGGGGADDKGNDETVETKSLSENEDQNHGDEETGLDGGGTDSRVTDNTDGHTGGKTRETDSEASGEVGETLVVVVGGGVSVGSLDTSTNNDGNDETVDTDDSGHNDGDDGAHDEVRLHDSHGGDTDTGLGGTVSSTEAGKDEGRGDTHVSEEVRGLVEAVLEEEEEGGEDLREHFCG